MARRTRGGGVQECKGFSPPNDHTTSASSTRLPLGSWDSNTRVPNTGRCSYSSKAKAHRITKVGNSSRQMQMQRRRRPHCQLCTKKRHRQAGEHKGECVTSNFYVEGTAVLCKKKKESSLFCVSTCSGVLEAMCCFAVSYFVCFTYVSPACCTVRTFRSR